MDGVSITDIDEIILVTMYYFLCMNAANVIVLVNEFACYKSGIV